MTETLEHNQNRLKLAHKLFSELLNGNPNLPPEVREELEGDCNLYEEELKRSNEETKRDRLRIHFEEKKIRIGSLTESIRIQHIRLLEYLIYKEEPVHWIEGIRIYNRWRKIRENIPKKLYCITINPFYFFTNTFIKFFNSSNDLFVCSKCTFISLIRRVKSLILSS